MKCKLRSGFQGSTAPLPWKISKRGKVLVHNLEKYAEGKDLERKPMED